MIFISYRRDDTRTEVFSLRNRLVDRYGAEAVFVDEYIDPGAVWPQTIEQRLIASRLVLVVIGRGWLAQFKTGKMMGRLRLEDPEDWVRREICTAVDRGIPIIVVCIDDATLPETEWRCQLDRLREIQAATLRTGPMFDSHVDKLVAAMERLVPALRPSGEAARDARAGGSAPPEAIADYAAAERRHHAALQLPLVERDGHPIVVSIDELRIDLPLIISHRRAADRDRARARSERAAASDDAAGAHTTSLLEAREAQSEEARRDCDIASALAGGAPLVIVGSPGSGKTTLLQWLCWHYASRHLDGMAPVSSGSLPDRDWLPILVRCRDLPGDALPAHLDDLLRGHLQRQQFSARATDQLVPHLVDRLATGRAMLLVDGLDEIAVIDRRIQLARLLASIAGRFSDAGIVVTSRVVGFQAIQAELAGVYSHLRIGPLDPEAKHAFVSRWSRLLGWDPAEEASLIERVCEWRDTARLTENVFLLAMVAQIPLDGVEPPHRLLDVCRRAVDLLIQRRRPGTEPPLSVNEVIPHLEHLAYRMRKQGLQGFTENDAVDTFRELRRLEADEAALQRRSPEALLRACVDAVGLLNVAGIVTDRRGFDRQLIEFVHPSFQEYFAGQALNHGRGAPRDEGVVARLRTLVDSIAISDHPIRVGRTERSEPVLADFWQDALRSAIADLGPDDANDALHMLLPTPATPRREARPRAVFALRCLLEQPPVSETTVTAVLDAAIDQLDAIDSGNCHTTMDDAMKLAHTSVHADRLRQRLLDSFIASRGDVRNRIGLCFVPQGSPASMVLTAETAPEILARTTDGLGSRTPAQRVAAALSLLDSCFLADGRLGFLAGDQSDSLVQALVVAARRDEATRSAALWAMSWLTGARIRTLQRPAAEPGPPLPAPDPRAAFAPSHAIVADRAPARKQALEVPSMLWLRSDVVIEIERWLQRSDVDPHALGHGALALDREADLAPVDLQRDWIYRLAQVADGELARRDLPRPLPTGRTRSLDWLRAALHRELPLLAATRIAQALGALGVFAAEMVPPLRELFRAGTRPFHNDDRDEAMLYLAFVADAEAVDVLVEAANTPPEPDDDYLYTRGLFGLLLVDDVARLARQLDDALPHADLAAYAYGLAGSRDPRGRELLTQRRNDANPRIRTAVAKALDNRALEPTPA